MDVVRELSARNSMEWGVVVQDVNSGRHLVAHNGEKVLRSASIGKLILLGFLGQAIFEDANVGAVLLDRRDVARVADSGIWQHLAVERLTVSDAAALVFLGSDNLATNVLLYHFGLDRVREARGAMGFEASDLLDIVRDRREPGHPRTLSCSSAAELAEFMVRLARGAFIHPSVSSWLRHGLSLNVDVSMVPAALSLDPLSHFQDEPQRGVPPLANKTGTDEGVRADTGIISLASGHYAYAAICNYDPDATSDREVLALMHAIGQRIVDSCSNA